MQRITEVDREGTFSMVNDPRILYQTMLQTRIKIVAGAPLMIMAASIIGIRYSCVRR
jgi:hypothetical protein